MIDDFSALQSQWESHSLYVEHSRPSRPGYTPHFFPIHVCYRWPQKITHTNFHIFLKFSDVMVEIADLTLRAVINSFEVQTISSLMKEK